MVLLLELSESDLWPDGIDKMSEADRRLSWEEIREVHTGLPPIELGWHQHHKGGGWVEDTAYVDRRCYIGPQAVVRGHAQVREAVRVLDRAVVRDSAVIFGRVQISGRARVGGSARIGLEAKICDDAVVTGKAIVRGDVVVCERAFVGGKARLVGWERIYDKMCVMENTMSSPAQHSKHFRDSDRGRHGIRLSPNQRDSRE